MPSAAQATGSLDQGEGETPEGSRGWPGPWSSEAIANKMFAGADPSSAEARGKPEGPSARSGQNSPCLGLSGELAIQQQLKNRWIQSWWSPQLGELNPGGCFAEVLAEYAGEVAVTGETEFVCQFSQVLL